MVLRCKSNIMPIDEVIFTDRFSLHSSIYVNTGCGLSSSNQDSPEENLIVGSNFAATRECTENMQVNGN